MAQFQPPPDDLLALAAELRAGGMAWDAVAAKVGRATATVRRWPTAYRRKWAAALRAAEAQLVADATAESVHTLRRQLRSDDEKASRDAAQKLIAFRVALGKTSKKSRKPAPTPGDAARVAAELEGLSDADLDALIADLLAGQNGGRPAAPPAA